MKGMNAYNEISQRIETDLEEQDHDYLWVEDALDRDSDIQRDELIQFVEEYDGLEYDKTDEMIRLDKRSGRSELSKFLQYNAEFTVFEGIENLFF